MRGRSRLTARLNVLLVVIVVLLGLNATVAVFAIRERDRERAAGTALRDVSTAVADLSQGVVSQQTGERGFLITGKDLQQYNTAEHETSLAEARIRKFLRTAPSNSPIRTSLAKVDESLAAWRNYALNVEIATRRRSGVDAAAITVASGRGIALFDELQSRITSLEAAVNTQLAASRALVQHTYDRVVRLVFFTLGAIVLMAIALAVLLARWITRPVERLASSVELVRAGDLDHPVEISGPSELVRIGTVVENMRARLVEEIARAERTAAELEVANGELDAFSYSVSHDLRAPLRSIDGFSQAILEDSGDQLDDVAKAHFARIRAATNRMAQLIDDLLKLSRVSRVAYVPVDVDISSAATQVVEGLRAADPGRSVAVTVQPGLRATADPSLVRILLENLLGNAWKFTGNTSAAEIRVSGEGRSPNTLFTVSDNGAGFDQAYVDKLFSPFQRLHTDREFPGNGVGLATVARIVHRHGGQVTATGVTGCGATITFSLAADPDAAATDGAG